MKLFGQHAWGSASTPLRRNVRKLSVLLLGFCLSAQAGVYQFQFSNFADSSNGNIPDGQTSGWTDSRTASTPGGTVITDVSVKLNIAGGFNGDLYCYLSHNGVLVPLLNRVGMSSSSTFGYSDSGLHVTLSDAGTLGDIHRYQQVAEYSSYGANGSGSWSPDGRTLDPLSAAAQFDSASRVGLSAFNGMNPNEASWTLFVADLSKGGGISQVQSWELNITAVPEPTNVALGIFLGIGAVTSVCRSPRLRRWMRARK